MIFSEEQKINELKIDDNVIDLRVIEVEFKGKIIKYIYHLFINGKRRFGFCSPILEDFDINQIINKFI